MKYVLLNILIVISVGFLLTGCSELQDDIAEPGGVMFHKAGILDPHSENFHGNLVKENHWDLKVCTSCHGENFTGLSSADCSTCHTAPEGPKACNTCHGVFADPSRFAPPTDLDNNFETTVKTVGAHAKHLYENVLGNPARCGSCHNFPQDVYASGHIDGDDIAEVNLKQLAIAFGASDAAYDPASATCSNTYCHGNFEFHKDSTAALNQFAYTADVMTGSNKTVDWTKVDQGEAECGTCHGTPGGPFTPNGHIDAPLDACYQCHQGVVDQTGNIIDRSKHINGEKNARGN